MALGPRAALAYRNAVRQQMIAGGMGLVRSPSQMQLLNHPVGRPRRRTQRGVEHAEYPTTGAPGGNRRGR